ncbi:MAG TPA: hypothetical protein VGU20_15205 [Stellaceae bacterium]|nr:hypothetical protein [Stellaceae bacterium]
MDRRLIAALVVAAGLSPSLAEARFSIGAGDLIFSDGQSFTYDEWEEYKKTHPEGGSAPTAAAPAAPQQYQQPAAPTEPIYQPQYQTQAPPSATVVNGRPVVTIAPPPVSAPLPIQGTPTVTAAAPAAVPTYAAAPATAAPALRAASCRSLKSYPEFPADTEKFDCGTAGTLTRQEMAAQGWHTDFIEKVPTVAGQASPNFYKIILSR